MKASSLCIVRRNDGEEQRLSPSELRESMPNPLEQLCLEMLAEESWSKDMEMVRCDPEKIVIKCSLFRRSHNPTYRDRVIFIKPDGDKIPTLQEVAAEVMDALLATMDTNTEVIEQLQERSNACEHARTMILFELAKQAARYRLPEADGDWRDRWQGCFVFHDKSKTCAVRVEDIFKEKKPVYLLGVNKAEFGGLRHLNLEDFMNK